ncbi:hypothetical protein RM780_09770 [Streptomyces sp. DSM 44917]|uniref:HNH endonuclease n=1 Tax=Streptomyces boetiae TaxID=3075541 RepID=A0ABU2L6R5_9ACTN|nr:hypothetical protein [Streptomyces sp. DSM 44917]MDT0307249.1 hypothetical protein [Streptomyces sp. DSM 44917]
MTVADTYVHEDYPGDEDREFWAQVSGPVAHTLEFEERDLGVAVHFWSESAGLDAPEWESRAVLEVTYRDLDRMIDRLTRLRERHRLRTRCDFCGSPHRAWVFEVPTGLLPDPGRERRDAVGRLDDGLLNACARCAGHVERKNARALARRAVRARARKDRRELSAHYAEQYAVLLNRPLHKHRAPEPA